MDHELSTILAAVFNLREDEITDASTMDNIAAWDSLKHMEMIYSVEEHFGIRLTADEIVEMTSVAAVERILKGKGASS